MTRYIPTEIGAEALEKFKDLYYKNFNERLSDEEATEQGLKLLRLMMALIENIEVGIDNGTINVIE